MDSKSKDLKALIDLGQQAEDFKRYLETNPYLVQVFERVKLGLFQTIMGLRPIQKDEFTIIKSRLDTLYEPFTVVDHDILAGQRAFQELESGKPPADGGIL